MREAIVFIEVLSRRVPTATFLDSSAVRCDCLAIIVFMMLSACVLLVLPVILSRCHDIQRSAAIVLAHQ